jgi:galactokinase
VFSAPGRIEITGNHTDHQHGSVLTAAVNLEMTAVVTHAEQVKSDTIIRINSEQNGSFEVNLTDLDARENERGTSAALVRGVAAWFVERGYKIGGFECNIKSDIPVGVGLSSSAAFEVLVGNILKGLYSPEVSALEIALAGKYAENVYFGKPCGLMDQAASSFGGLLSVDFCNPQNPVVMGVTADLGGYAFCVVETGGSHEDLTADYTSITDEMKAVSNFFGADVLRDVDSNLFYSSIADLRFLGERAIVRAIHFFEENRRVPRQIESLERGDIKGFLQLVTESGRSSTAYLQNIYSTSDPTQQGLSLALALCEKILGHSGAYRVHGGGFGGTVLAIIPLDMRESFESQMSAVFGDGCCHFMQINPLGGREITCAKSF